MHKSYQIQNHKHTHIQRLTLEPYQIQTRTIKYHNNAKTLPDPNQNHKDP